MGRTLTLEIFRYNPLDPTSTPHMQRFNLGRASQYDALHRAE